MNDPVNYRDLEGYLKVEVTLTVEAQLEVEVSSGILPGGKGKLTLKGTVSVTVTIEEKDWKSVRERIRKMRQNLYDDLIADLQEKARAIRTLYELLDRLF